MHGPGGGSDHDAEADADPGELETAEDDGRTVYVSRREAETGSDAPFFVVYASPDAVERYGWLCGNCETMDNAMDSMGRIECNRCPNYRKPTSWDAAHE